MSETTNPSTEQPVGSDVVEDPPPIDTIPQNEGKLIFILEWCKRCGLCSIACPTNALEENEDHTPFLARPDDCKFCSICWKVCPDFAIIKNPNWKEAKNGTE